jgi:ectoine hydroxylase-related dioxygenase (phytanoyl-CoA dioxygenase family)
MDAHLEVNKNGLLLVPNMVSPDEASGLLYKLVSGSLPRSRAGIRHLMANDAVAEVARSSRIRAIARSILGSDAFPFRATLFDKSSDSNWLVVWHQDTALPLRARSDTPGWGPWSVKDGINYAHAPTRALEQVVALRLHLDDSTEQNGPFRVLRGTHKVGVLSDEEVEKLSRQIPAPMIALPPKAHYSPCARS